jgi:hypothetical protein
MSQMLVISHRFKKIGLHNLVVRRIFSDILLVLGFKKVEKHCTSRIRLECSKNIRETSVRGSRFGTRFEPGTAQVPSRNVNNHRAMMRNAGEKA